MRDGRQVRQGGSAREREKRREGKNWDILVGEGVPAN